MRIKLYLPPKSGLRQFESSSRHTLVLIIAGLTYVATGTVMYSYTPGTPRYEALVMATHVLPIAFWATIFILVGILASILSIWPKGATGWGYGLLTGLASGWSATHLMGVLVANTPLINCAASLYWALVALLWWSISGLLDPKSERSR